jgi:DNA-binding Lrp family transcriptional regulator
MRDLDEIDAEILRALQHDGRMSNKALADRVGLAPSSCLERVRQLREWGVLLSTRVELEPSALGIGLQALIAVRIRASSVRDRSRVFSGLAGLPEVVAAYAVSGPEDIVLHVACRDAEHLGTLVDERVRSVDGVGRVQCSLVRGHVHGPLPIYGADDAG